MHADTLDTVEAKEQRKIVISPARRYTLLALFGKIADIYSAKVMLVLGITWVGAFSIGIALAQDKVVLFVLRALAGLGAAAGIPASINLIIHVFPDQQSQHLALAAFGGAGELANVRTASPPFRPHALTRSTFSWKRDKRLHRRRCSPPRRLALGILAPPDRLFPIGGAGGVVGTASERVEGVAEAGVGRGGERCADGDARRARELLRTLEGDAGGAFDYVGSFLVVAAAVLSVFGLTDGGEGSGWGRAQPIATLVIGLLLFPVFFWYESRIDQRTALIPSSIWKIRNVGVLTVVSLVPYFWWYALQYIYANVMQLQWGVSSIMTAVHFLPISIGGGIIFILIGYLPPQKFPLKIRMVLGALVGMVGTILLIFGQNQKDYWPFVATGFFIGSIGIAMVFISANNSLLMAVPTEYSGVVGGVFNATLQLGAVAGLAINATIQSFFPDHAAEVSGEHRIAWKGYQSNFIFMAAVVAVLAIVSAIWFKNPYESTEDTPCTEMTERDSASER
ncbi:hypothetical protein QFC20_006714 [Naganishia adeliensis]|uniref:Uncharacterized protein n=1 Tax=Naganishia adeliensis TaxID=92952 RepID=A0ACC2V8E3_9TREE|nr:hypothetical protein QFC20_006714 [Naganishia adeliensis]